MNPKRWQQIEALFESARDLEPSQRDALLAEACTGDEELRREVESLLRHQRGDDNFRTGAAVQIAAQALGQDSGQSFIGQEIGSYKILSLLGLGGMGEVYRATDTRLHRTVAIKILPHDKVADPERKRRFLQEARAVSALNHPNIVTLHDIANDGGIDYLVMEYLPGKSLDKLITPKGLPLAEALNYVQQIASALAAAHTAGIVHRDIKPANVIVTAESQVKVLDFGLAKLQEPEGGAETLTEAGTIMGTVAYMSPEQASAKPLDHRTDIFSLGIILYEIVAGTCPFRGKSQVETMHAIINEPAPPLPAEPAELEDILAKALAKDPKDRYQHAGDFALDLRRFQQRPVGMRHAAPGTRSAQRLPWIAAAVLMLALPVTWWAGRRAASTIETAPSADVSITPLTTDPGYNGEPTISPDNQTIAYVSDRAGRFDLFLRQIGSGTDIPLTRDQGDNIQPSFSPDGRQIAFVSSRSGGPVIFYPCCDYPLAGGDIWVMPALGGTARRIAQEGNFPSWSPDGSTIVFTRRGRGANLSQVPSGGGEVHEVPLQFKSTAPNQLGTPTYSADGRWIFFASQVGQSDSIFAVPSNGGTVLQLTKGRHPAWDSASQSVIYVNSNEGRNNSLWVLPFSTADGEAGQPRPLTVGRGRDWRPAVSRDGKVIAFTALTATFNMEVAPFDAEAGKVLGAPRVLTSGNQIIYFMRFSPDGRSVVFQSSRGAGSHIWRVDAGAEAVQLTSDPKFEEVWPSWSPDGATISFVRNPVQSPLTRNLWLMAADGANPRQIGEGAGTPRWLPDGSGLLYTGTNDAQISIFELASGRSTKLPGQSARASMLSISSDGKWVVYQSNVVEGSGAGNQDVGAIPLNGGAGRVVFSTPHQEMHPFLSVSGRWLYFQWEHKNIYRVPGPAQDWKKTDPVKVTEFPESGLFLEDPQISRDGKQFLFSRANISADIWILRRGK